MKKVGGDSIVECSSHGIRTNNHELHLFIMSLVSQINIIFGTGYYLARTHPKNMNELTIDQLTQQFINDITIGIDISNQIDSFDFNYIQNIDQNTVINELQKQNFKIKAGIYQFISYVFFLFLFGHTLHILCGNAVSKKKNNLKQRFYR